MTERLLVNKTDVQSVTKPVTTAANVPDEDSVNGLIVVKITETKTML